MQAVLFKVFRWLIGASQVKFVLFTAIFAMVSYFQGFIVSYISPFASTSSLTSAFNGLSPAVWYFINVFNLSFGIPLCIGAFVVRFLVRRIPFFG